MGASNWAVCPRCRSRKQSELDQAQAEVDSLYGKVPVTAFDAARDKFERRDWSVPETFREDYEIFGADDGDVRVIYSGRCETCHLSLQFDESHPIDMEGTDTK